MLGSRVMYDGSGGRKEMFVIAERVDSHVLLSHSVPPQLLCFILSDPLLLFSVTILVDLFRQTDSMVHSHTSNRLTVCIPIRCHFDFGSSVDETSVCECVEEHFANSFGTCLTHCIPFLAELLMNILYTSRFFFFQN